MIEAIIFIAALATIGAVMFLAGIYGRPK